MTDADDATILRPVVRAVAAAIFCLLCGSIAGLFVVREDVGSAGQQVDLAPSTPARPATAP